jgi:hypothetical protein
MPRMPKLNAAASHHALIGRVMLDDEFRQALIEDPQKALTNAGIQLPAADVTRFTNMTKEERHAVLGHMNPIAVRGYYDGTKGI